MSASELQLINMTDAAIAAEVVNHYLDMHKALNDDEPSSKAVEKFQTRLCHSGVLYAEGQRLSKTHPELGKKLILASNFWGDTRGYRFLEPSDRKTIEENLCNILKEEEEERERKRQMMRRH